VLTCIVYCLRELRWMIIVNYKRMHDCDVLVCQQMALYEDLLKKEGEITALKAKALQLMRNHEEAIGYDDMRQQLQQLGNVL